MSICCSSAPRTSSAVQTVTYLPPPRPLIYATSAHQGSHYTNAPVHPLISIGSTNAVAQTALAGQLPSPVPIASVPVMDVTPPISTTLKIRPRAQSISLPPPVFRMLSSSVPATLPLQTWDSWARPINEPAPPVLLPMLSIEPSGMAFSSYEHRFAAAAKLQDCAAALDEHKIIEESETEAALQREPTPVSTSYVRDLSREESSQSQSGRKYCVSFVSRISRYSQSYSISDSPSRSSREDN